MIGYKLVLDPDEFNLLRSCVDRCILNSSNPDDDLIELSSRLDRCCVSQFYKSDNE